MDKVIMYIKSEKTPLTFIECMVSNDNLFVKVTSKNSVTWIPITNIKKIVLK